MTTEANEPDLPISIVNAASLLQIGPERVRQLIREGFIPRNRRATPTLRGAIQGLSLIHI